MASAIKTNITSQSELDAALKAGNRILNFTKAGEYEINDTADWIDIYAAVELNIFNFIIKTKANISLRARGSSAPRVVAWESSAPYVVARESSAPRVEARESSAPRVVAWESSAPYVVARESSAPYVEARESSAPRVEARESSAPYVEARESSAPRVEASGYVQISIFGKVIGTISAKCNVMLRGKGHKIKGGNQTIIPQETAQDWCDYYGVKVENGLARVYKALNEGFSSNHNRDFKYLPGTKPKAEIFDDKEYSQGLHFSPHPVMTHEFIAKPKHYVECWVEVKNMLVFFEGSYPRKCKAPEVKRPVVEVDIDGNHLKAKKAKSAA